MKWPWRRGRHCLGRQQRQWVPMLPAEMEAATAPIPRTKEDEDGDVFLDFYYDQTYLETLRNRAFLDDFFANASTDR